MFFILKSFNECGHFRRVKGPRKNDIVLSPESEVNQALAGASLAKRSSGPVDPM